MVQTPRRAIAPLDEFSKKKKSDSAMTESRDEHRQILLPLRVYLAKFYQTYTFEQLGRIVASNLWRPHRILSGEVASPTWVDMTRLITEAGLTPNQAAQMCGLYTPKGEQDPLVLGEDTDPRLLEFVKSLHDGTLSDKGRDNALSYIQYLLTSFLNQEKLRREGVRRHAREKKKTSA